jgi:pilus assembly protein CpaF
MSTAAAPLPVVRARSFGNNSHVDAARALQEASVESGRLRDAARAAFRQALRPEVSGIAPEALAQASARVRVEVEQLARGVITTLQDAHSREHKAPITDIMGQGLIQYLLDCQFGAGALEPLFAAGDVEDICVNTRPGADGDRRVEVFTFRAGGKKREEIDITVDEVIELANRHAASQGRSLNTASPVLSAQMASGARLNAVLDPVCDGGVSMTIRLHRLVARTLDDLVALGTLSVQAANYIHLMAHAGVSMVIAGGTGSGKTNLLNAVARSMPQDLRCVVIEDTRELQLEIADVVYLRTVESPDNRITQRQLVANALRMRPDRIVIGEVRDGAAWDAIKATNTGHAGTLLTIHAEDAHAVITRLMQLCAEAPETANMSEQRLVQTISSAFNTVVFIERTRDGSGRMHRAVKQITDMTGQVSDGQPQQIDLFRFQDGALRRTSARPHASTMRVFRQGGYSEQQVMDAMESETPIWMGHAAA